MDISTLQMHTPIISDNFCYLPVKEMSILPDIVDGIFNILCEEDITIPDYIHTMNEHVIDSIWQFQAFGNGIFVYFIFICFFFVYIFFLQTNNECTCHRYEKRF